MGPDRHKIRRPLFSRRLMLAVVLWIGFVSPAWMAPVRAEELSRPARQALFEAQKAMKAGNYDGAVRVLGAYLKTDPKNSPALVYLLLGNAHYQAGDKHEARAAFQQGHRLAPGDASLCLNYAIAAYETGHYKEAGLMFEKTYALQKRPELLYQSGAAYVQAKQYARAKKVLGLLLRSAGKIQTAWLELSIHAFTEARDWTGAERILRRLLGQKPDAKDYWRLLAQVRLKKKDYRGAAAALEIACRVETPRPDELHELANLYFYLNAPLLGAGVLERAYGRKPPSGVCDTLFTAYAQAHRYDRAVAYLDLALNQAPTAGRWLKKGRLLYEAGRYPEAIQALQNCLRLDAGQGEAHLLAALAAWETRDWSGARQAFAAAVRFPAYRAQAQAGLKAMEELLSVMGQGDPEETPG